jgi:hypothetical protein
MGTLCGKESPGIALLRGRALIRIGEAELLSGSLFGCQFLSTNLNECRHTGGIDSEAVSDEIVVGTHLVQTQPDPISPRKVIRVGRLHGSSVPETGLGILSTRY